MSDSISSPQPPLQQVLPCYLYAEYADDPNLQAFFAALNVLAAVYLRWYNATPLGLYTSPNITGPLLDWIAAGIYGVERPVFASLVTRSIGAIDSWSLNTLPVDGAQTFQSGVATTATDDYFKRTLTWLTYIGNGRHFNLQMLRMRVARFIYGVNGADIPLSLAANVNITASGHTLTITVPTSQGASHFFQQAVAQGILPLPFQLSATIVLA